MMTPAAFIARTNGGDWREGDPVCALWAAEFWREVTGVDVAAPYRGRYARPFEWRRMILLAGGLEEFCRKAMAEFRSGETQNGVCVARVGGRTFCGILSGGRLFIRSAGGVYSPTGFTLLEGWGA
ncbi:DUF6950 family protein [Defluviimonas sp. SAOS-178_SWC]|uniref:DUF6950 family protein n=1 Tax=Defluviimonas sp. SAOS-178_SWC TaxID=3121287 RepID=UPI003221A6F5